MRHVEVEARAYANADYLTREIVWGGVLGFLEVGAAFGYWSKRSADAVSETVRHRWRIGRIRKLVRPR